MKLKLLALSFVLSACSVLAPQPTPTATATQTPRPTATATPLPTATLPPVADCKLSRVWQWGMGYPLDEARLDSTGTVIGTVLFVDFDDAAATRTPQEVFDLISPSAETWFRDVSGGRMNFVLQPYFKWLRLSKPSADYGEAIYTFEPHRAWIQEAMDLADAEVDFSNTDTVIVMSNPDASAITFGPTYLGYAGAGLYADGVEITNGVTSAADLLYWYAQWLNHESGHSMGLPDLYIYGVSPEEQFEEIGDFSIMGNIYGAGAEYTAFERWMLGWLDDNQVACIQEPQAVISLNAIELHNGVQAAMVPLGENRVLVVESRRQLGYDQYLYEEGALVYVVDVSVEPGYGVIQIQNNNPDDFHHQNAPLSPGESITVEGVTITLVESSETADTIEITQPQ